MTITVGPNLGLMVNGVAGEFHYPELMKLLRGLDALVMPHAIARVDTLPATPNDGDVYIYTTDNRVARYSAITIGWEYYTPREGWFFYSQADDTTYEFNGLNWVEGSSGGGGMSNPMTTKGDLIVGGTSGAPTRLPISSVLGRVLTVSAEGVVSWADPVSKQKYTAVDSSAATLTLSNASTTIWGINLKASLTTLVLPTADSTAFSLSLIFTQDANGGRVVTWPGNLTWVGGEAPVVDTQANARTIVNVLSVDGGQTYLGISLSGFAGGTLKRALNDAPPVDFDTTSDTVIPAATLSQANDINVNGSAGLTGMGEMPSGAKRWLRFSGVQALTHSTSFAMKGATNITTGEGDSALMISLGGGNWEMRSYQRKDGSALLTKWTGGNLTQALNEATPPTSTEDDGIAHVSNASNTLYQNGTSDLTALSELPEGAVRRVIFNSPRKLIHSSVLQLIGGMPINALAGDMAEFLSQGNGNWLMVDYVSAARPINQGTVTVPAADTLDLGLANSTNVLVSGASAITNLGNARNGTRRLVRFTAAGSVLTHGTKLSLPGSQSITVAARDTVEFLNVSTDPVGDIWVGFNYTRADGKALVGSSSGGGGGGDFTGGKLLSALNEANIGTIVCAEYLNLTDDDAWNTAFLQSNGDNNLIYGLSESYGVGGITPGSTRRLIMQTDVTIASQNGIETIDGSDIAAKSGDVVEFLATEPGFVKVIDHYSSGGGGGGVEGFEGSYAYDEFGQALAQLKVKGLDYAVEMRLVPIRSGAISASRQNEMYGSHGQWVVDLQRNADDPSQSAVGDFSALLGGQYNAIQAQSAAVVGGERNMASGPNSFIGGGTGADSKFLQSSHAFASGKRNQIGDSQSREAVMYNTTTDGTTLTLLQAGGGPTSLSAISNFVVEVSGAYLLTIQVVAQSASDRAAWRLEVLVYSPGPNTVNVEGTPLITTIAKSAGAADWSVEVLTGPGLPIIPIKVNGADGQTINWVGKVTTVETFGF